MNADLRPLQARAVNYGSLTLAALTAVFTINYVAEMFGEDQDWLWELQIDLFA